MVDEEVFKQTHLPLFLFSLLIWLSSGREQLSVKQENMRPFCAQTVNHRRPITLHEKSSYMMQVEDVPSAKKVVQ